MITIAIIILALSVIMISCFIKAPPEPTARTLAIEPAIGVMIETVGTIQVTFGDTLEKTAITDTRYSFKEWENITMD